MARTNRSRSRSRLEVIASAKGVWRGSPETTEYPVFTTESCDDYIGAPVVPSSFTLNRVDRSGVGGLNGRAVLDELTFNVKLEHFLPGYQRSGSISHLSTDAPNPALLGSTVLSRTNPSRPTIVPFTLVQDCVDIPRMLKDVGRLARTPRRLLSPKEQANQFLGAKFGWLPLIDDANKLLHLQQYIHARVGELRRLYSEQGLRRRLQLGSNSANTADTEVVYSESFTGIVLAKTSYGTTVKTWGTVRWKPDNLPMPGWQPSDAELIQKAIQICSGLTTEGVIKGAWDLLPWSWMIDWFGNVGDWLTQGSSTVPASPSSICIMQESNTIGQHSLLTQPSYGLKDAGGHVIRTTKTRSPVTGSLAASLPTLDASRLSVLGALFVQRFKR